jgi:FixJ family two-component response regulator
LFIVSIVDDDESVRDATRGFVRSLGYDAAAFASAEEFLSSDRLNDTVCLVTDVQMPGLSGIELQSRLAGQAHRIPIIFVTASPEECIRRRAKAAGAFGYFNKPFDEDLFIGCLNRAVSSATADAIPCEAIMPAEAS